MEVSFSEFGSVRFAVVLMMKAKEAFEKSHDNDFKWGGLLVSKISVLAKILPKIWPKFGQNRLFFGKMKCFLAEIFYFGQNKTGFGQNKNDFGQNFCEQNH